MGKASPLPHLTHPTQRAEGLTHPAQRAEGPTHLPYLPCSVVVFSSDDAGGFGGRGRFIDKLTPFQNVSTFRSTTCRPCAR